LSRAHGHACHPRAALPTGQPVPCPAARHRRDRRRLCCNGASRHDAGLRAAHRPLCGADRHRAQLLPRPRSDSTEVTMQHVRRGLAASLLVGALALPYVGGFPLAYVLILLMLALSVTTTPLPLEPGTTL